MKLIFKLKCFVLCIPSPPNIFALTKNISYTDVVKCIWKLSVRPSVRVATFFVHSCHSWQRPH